MARFSHPQDPPLSVAGLFVIFSVRGQLSEANNKLLRLYSDNDRLSHERKSPNYHPDKQLEELRTLQVRIGFAVDGNFPRAFVSFRFTDVMSDFVSW